MIVKETGGKVKKGSDRGRSHFSVVSLLDYRLEEAYAALLSRC